MANLRLIAFAGLLALLASSANAYGNITIRFGGDIGPINQTGYKGDVSSGLYSIPSGGGEGIIHTKLFLYANQVSYDPASKLLWAVDVNDTRHVKVWNTSAWTSTDITSPDFDPVPIFETGPEGCNYVYDVGYVWYNFLPPQNGKLYQISCDAETYFVDEWDLTGKITPVANITPGGFIDAFVQTTDFKLMYSEVADIECATPTGDCLSSNVSIISISTDYKTLTVVKTFTTQCPMNTWIMFLGISPDQSTLIVGCYASGVNFFDITDPLNPVDAGYKTVSDTGGVISPSTACQFPGGLMGNGYADATTLSAWINDVNDSYAEATALTQTAPTIQLAAFPSYEPLWWCAITQQAHALTMSASYLTFFRTSSPSTYFHQSHAPCSAMNWVGTFAGHEHFFHLNSPECNCASKTTSPCPPGMVVEATGLNITDYVGQWGPWLVSGRDYEPATSARSPAAFSNTSWPLFVVNYNDTTGFSPYECIDGTIVIDVNDTRYMNKWVLAFPTPTCSYTKLAYWANVKGGAAGVIIGLPAGRDLFYLSVPVVNFPIVVMSHPQAVALAEAWIASNLPAAPVAPVAPPRMPLTPTKTGQGRVEVSVALLVGAILSVMVRWG